jgi:hypothetical protein
VNIGLGLLIEGFVALLLCVTISWCILLNRRLKRLRSDEQTLKATIAELITATEIAERAVAGLKLTVRDCDQSLGERLRSAERLSADLLREIEQGGVILNKLGLIAQASRPLADVGAPQPIAAGALATVEAAQAFAARQRLRGQAAA